MPAATRALIVGCGYVGTRLARALLPEAPVVALTRTAEAATVLDRQGIDALRWDLDDPACGAPPGLATVATVFYLVPPPAGGRNDPRLSHFLAHLTNVPARILYVSTTGVYGDTGGVEVDEEAALNPGSDRAWRRIAAESELRAWSARLGVPWTVLRVPAIYGPGRLPIARLKRQEPMIRHSEAPHTSRIHVDDLVGACLLAARSPRAKNRIYNVSDGHSTTMTEYFERVATLAGLPTPALLSRAEAERALPGELWSYLAESRRVSSRRIREELGFAPRFSDLRLGILSSLPGP